MPIRVYQLAKELGTDSMSLMARLEAMGQRARSASSVLEPSAVRALRCGGEPAAPAVNEAGLDDYWTLPSAAADEVRELARALGARLPGVPGPRQASPAQDQSNAPGGTAASAGTGAPRPWPLVPSNRPRKPAVSKRHRETRGATESQVDWQWSKHLFTPEERKQWIAAGLGERDATIAAQCRSQGMLLHHLGLRVHGRSVANRVRGGESVASVAARLREVGRLD